ncbi:nucleotidyltransferase domain-containing protein [Kribbella sp. C-35]|uniref:nucleotidyltransferase domain-containing protein n=1 Tax=Kribbella sp. C-35 TaxID=2789276 RepID=UPI00397A27B3
MGEVRETVYGHMAELLEHGRVLGAVLDFFRPRAVGAFVCGSVARGGMDKESDLDIGIVLPDATVRDAVWAERWDWEIAPWFHRFDADHVKPYFVIYLYEPRIKADISLYTPDELPHAEGGPYVIAWDDAGRLDDWAQSAVPTEQAVDWSPAMHEEERFWAWVIYCVQHVRRGEYYAIAADFEPLRDIVEQWQARLAGHPAFTIRRTETLFDTTDLAQLFPTPDRADLKRALLKLIDLHDQQRAQLNLPWRTTETARERIRRWVTEL